MKLRNIAISLMSIVAYGALPAAAQSVCHEILEGGAFQHLARNENSYSSLVYASRLEQMSYNEAMKDLSANGGITIKGLPFSASMSQQQYESNLQQLRNSIDINSVSTHAVQLAVADGDKTITSAWEGCTAALTGIVITMKEIDTNTIQLSIVYKPYPNSTRPIIQPGTQVSNASIVAGSEFLREGSDALGVASTRLITLRRTSSDAAVLATVNTNMGGASAYLPPRPRAVKPTRPVIQVAATEYRSGLSQNIAPTTAAGNPNWVYGSGIANGGPPWDADRYNRAVYMVSASREGPYKLEISYAAAQARPVQIQVRGTNGEQDQVYANKLSVETGGWCLDDAVPKSTVCAGRSNLQWGDAGIVNLRAGINEVWIERGSVFPHLKALRLSYVGM